MKASLDRLGELWPAGDVQRFDPKASGHALHGVMEVAGSLQVLPLHDRRACRNAVARWTDATTTREVLIRGAAVLALGLLGGRVLPTHRIGVKLHSDTPGKQTLHDYLADSLGVPSVSVSANLGSARPNQKPMVRIHGARGETIGYAKIGWNELTRSLVETEEHFLAGHRRDEGARFRTPTVLHSGLWRGRYIVVMSPLSGGPRIRRRRGPDLELVEAISRLDGVVVHRLADSPYVRQTTARIDMLRGSHRDQARSALERLMERWDDERVAHGRWHGDFTPWNVNTASSTAIVWDWERTVPATPVGFDVIHWEFHTRMEPLGSGAEVLKQAAAAAASSLEALGVSASAVPALVDLYALEMFLRFTTERGAATPPWLRGLLDPHPGERHP